MGLELRCCEGLGFRVRGVWGLGSRGVAGGGGEGGRRQP